MTVSRMFVYTCIKYFMAQHFFVIIIVITVVHIIIVRKTETIEGPRARVVEPMKSTVPLTKYPNYVLPEHAPCMQPHPLVTSLAIKPAVHATAVNETHTHSMPRQFREHIFCLIPKVKRQKNIYSEAADDSHLPFIFGISGDFLSQFVG